MSPSHHRHLLRLLHHNMHPKVPGFQEYLHVSRFDLDRIHIDVQRSHLDHLIWRQRPQGLLLRRYLVQSDLPLNQKNSMKSYHYNSLV